MRRVVEDADPYNALFTLRAFQAAEGVGPCKALFVFHSSLFTYKKTPPVARGSLSACAVPAQ